MSRGKKRKRVRKRPAGDGAARDWRETVETLFLRHPNDKKLVQGNPFLGRKGKGKMPKRALGPF